MLRTAVIMTLFLMNAVGWARAEPVPQCLAQSSPKDGRVTWRNTCDYPISVAYCSSERPIWGQRCGDGKGTSLYYTHMTRIQPGEIEERPESYRSASCKGVIYSVRDYFSSTANGSFLCGDPDSKTKLVISTATSADDTQDSACQAALRVAQRGAAEVNACECRQQGRKYLCQVHTAALPAPARLIPDEVVPKLKQELRKATECHPTPEKPCKAKPSQNPGGVRG